MTKNQILSIVVEQGVEKLAPKAMILENDALEVLNKQKDKFSFEEFDEITERITHQIAKTQNEFYEEGFKQGVNFILSMPK
ncbi:hypothetical protein [Bacillus cereus group sp. BfR-BA-00415]|uniref:hypothetical protein n=1 Tax=Bacillus cereus group sp. BfR-BA-00415 TaxID=3094867 RepID=UPI0029C2785F|nr:hypothetical protein [Bacillus cereus group sp. BfR-BA-00415]MDX5942352.1 hypothetical protein [Bacillus cereus group sp. BfR-BA-00415]